MLSVGDAHDAAGSRAPRIAGNDIDTEPPLATRLRSPGRQCLCERGSVDIKIASPLDAVLRGSIQTLETAGPYGRHQDVYGLTDQHLLFGRETEISKDRVIKFALQLAITRHLLQVGKGGELGHADLDRTQCSLRGFRIRSIVGPEEGEGFDVAQVDTITLAKHLPAAQHEEVACQRRA